MCNTIYVGIDLGTTNTLVAYKKKEAITTLKFADAAKVLPSVLFLNPDTKKIAIGGDAIRAGHNLPENIIRSAKTEMGNPDKTYKLKVNGSDPLILTPTDVAAEVLKTAKDRIIKRLKLEPDDEICAVITVPAAFSAPQKEETKKAAAMAGLNCLELLPEPVAAAIACADSLERDSMVFVVDIGGGTYDTAVLKCNENLQLDIVCQAGDRHLGGDDFDKVLYDYICDRIGDELGIDISEESKDLNREEYLELSAIIRERAEEAKRDLSNAPEYIARFNGISIENFNHNQPIDLAIRITREVFNTECADIFKRIEKRLDLSISDYKKLGNELSSLTHLVLVGGSCYIPKVIEICENKIGMSSSRKCDKTTAIAEGAGYMANNLTTLGRNLGGLVAQSMGIQILGERFSKIIKRNEKYPCRRNSTYTTTYDNQNVVNIRIYYAAPDKEDCDNVNEHEYYGYISLDDIQRAKAGVPQIDVTFDFDSSEQLTVSATDRATGSTKSVKVERSYIKDELQQCTPTAIELLIDVSGSMAGEPLNDAKAACKKLVNEIVDFSTNEVGITSFADYPIDICSITSDQRLLLECIPQMSARGGTNMDDGIEKSYNKLMESNKQDKIIFLLTDGAPNSGDRSETISATIRQNGNVRLAVIYIGRNDTRGYRIANQVAKANALPDEEPLFYTSNRMSELGLIFKKIYAEITIKR